MCNSVRGRSSNSTYSNAWQATNPSSGVWWATSRMAGTWLLSDAAQTRPVVTRQAVGHGGGGRFGIIAFRPDQRHAILAVERHSAVAEEPDEQQQYARCKDYAAEKHQRRFQVFIPRRCGQQTVYDQQYDARKRQTKGYDFRFASFDDDPVRQRIKAAPPFDSYS